MATCRLCDGGEAEVGRRGGLVKYQVRHHVHAACGLERWGARLFDRLSQWQLRQFPVLYAQRAGLLGALEAAIESRPCADGGSPPADVGTGEPDHE
jgi:hypothetical protein